MASKKAFTVMIAVDGSEQSQAAFNWYLAMQHKPGNELVLAHIREVIQPAFGFRAGLGVSKEQWLALEKQAQEQAKQLEESFAKLLKEKNVTYTFLSAEGLNPGNELCTIAKAQSVDMVVIGCRGLGTVRRTIMGSVSDYVLHHTHVPVCIHHAGDA